MIAPKKHRWSFAALLLLVPASSPAQQQNTEWHPDLKELWHDADTWTTITPAELNFDPAMMVGLRATYRRGENLVRDPLIEEAGFQFERGWLKGKPIVIARFQTSGDRSRAESGPSGWTTLVDPTSMESLGSMSSSVRWGGFSTRKTETGTIRWRLGVDDTEWSDPEVVEEHEPMIDLSMWGHVLAGMRLEEGMKFRLQAFPSWIGPVFHVAGRTTFEDTQGRTYSVWAVETLTYKGRSGWLGITYVRDEAPYFIGFELRHVETGDVEIRWRLKDFQRLGG